MDVYQHLQTTFLQICCVTLIVLGIGANAALAPAAQFVFGDSLVDQGNNNYLTSLAKANSPPNGLDLALADYKPTGRFCNGRIVSDFMSEHMGVEPILAYLDPEAKGTNLLRGVNFGSAGSGILDDTGAIFIQHLTIPQQLKYYQNVRNEIESLIGLSAAQTLFAKAVYSFTIGGNDFINNYLLPDSIRARTLTVPQFSQLLVSTFKTQITHYMLDVNYQGLYYYHVLLECISDARTDVQQIYNLGARKISISGIGPIGCIPNQLSTKSVNGECVESVNMLARSFNDLLQPMLVGLNKELSGAVILYANSYRIVSDLINYPAQYGFQISKTACCGAGRFNGLIVCTQISPLCSNRNDYVFWDAYHPTDKANGIVTNRLLYGPPSDISPINVSQLMAL